MRITKSQLRSIIKEEHDRLLVENKLVNLFNVIKGSKSVEKGKQLYDTYGAAVGASTKAYAIIDAAHNQILKQAGGKKSKDTFMKFYSQRMLRTTKNALDRIPVVGTIKIIYDLFRDVDAADLKTYMQGNIWFPNGGPNAVIASKIESLVDAIPVVGQVKFGIELAAMAIALAYDIGSNPTKFLMEVLGISEEEARLAMIAGKKQDYVGPTDDVDDSDTSPQTGEDRGPVPPEDSQPKKLSERSLTNMRITKNTLKQIIKEELEVAGDNRIIRPYSIAIMKFPHKKLEMRPEDSLRSYGGRISKGSLALDWEALYATSHGHPDFELPGELNAIPGARAKRTLEIAGILKDWRSTHGDKYIAAVSKLAAEQAAAKAEAKYADRKANIAQSFGPDDKRIPMTGPSGRPIVKGGYSVKRSPGHQEALDQLEAEKQEFIQLTSRSIMAKYLRPEDMPPAAPLQREGKLRITKNTLKQIIKEELEAAMAGGDEEVGPVLYHKIVRKMPWLPAKYKRHDRIQADLAGAFKALLAACYMQAWTGRTSRNFPAADQAKIKGALPKIQAMIKNAAGLDLDNEGDRKKAEKIIDELVPGVDSTGADRTPAGLAATGMGRKLGLDPSGDDTMAPTRTGEEL